jgi:hypothetical protein
MSIAQNFAQNRVRLNGRGLIEILLICSLLTLATLTGWWYWQTNGGRVVALEGPPTFATSDPLVAMILHHPAILTTAVLVEFLLLLGLILAVVPPTWWLQVDLVVNGVPVVAESPLQWLGRRLHLGGAKPIDPAQDPTHNPTHDPAQPVAVDAQGLPLGASAGQTAGQPTVAGLPGVAGQPPAPGQPGVPGQPPTPGQPGKPADPADPNAAPPNAPPSAPALTDVLQFSEEEEDDPLADLANIKDILNSAFDEDAGLDPTLEALGRSIDEISIQALVQETWEVAARFRQGPYA